jgi:hypothetical protein
MSATDEAIWPRPEPEVMRANARRSAKYYNERKCIYIAMEIIQHAYEAHGLPHKPGFSHLAEYTHERFHWFCDEAAPAAECLKIRDDRTGRVVTDPMWYPPS